MWPDATRVLPDHRAHLLVTLFHRTGTVLERKMRLTRVTAAAAQVSNALGVYWGDAPAVHSLADFIDAAKTGSVESPPMHTWLALSITTPAADRVSLLTFGHPPSTPPQPSSQSTSQPTSANRSTTSDPP